MKPIYTLCFLNRDDSILLLLRNKQPNKGFWNGVGGKIEEGETPLESCLREVKEETGFDIGTARFCGVLSWSGHESGEGALYLYTADAPDGEYTDCSEGVLKWHSKEWTFSSPDVVSNIHFFGPRIYEEKEPKLYQVEYEDNEIISHCVAALPKE